LPAAVDLIGSVAAVITTVGWLPQVIKIRRERKADDISMIATAAIGTGVLLWFFYGLMIGSWPVIAANGVTFLFVAAILLLKRRYARLPATPQP
jgi:MtN3 and saliva related transmembrane protein